MRLRRRLWGASRTSPETGHSAEAIDDHHVGQPAALLRWADAARDSQGRSVVRDRRVLTRGPAAIFGDFGTERAGRQGQERDRAVSVGRRTHTGYVGLEAR